MFIGPITLCQGRAPRHEEDPASPCPGVGPHLEWRPQETSACGDECYWELQTGFLASHLLGGECPGAVCLCHTLQLSTSAFEACSAEPGLHCPPPHVRIAVEPALQIRPLTDEWTHTLGYTYAVERFSALKRRGILACTSTWMNLEDSM